MKLNASAIAQMLCHDMFELEGILPAMPLAWMQVSH